MTNKLPIPEAALTQHGIALGKTRSGKSSKVRVIVEWLLGRHKPVTIIDVKGDWWGLKSDASGRHAGYPIVIFGGKHADVPINPQSGTQLAELLSKGNRPALIDLKGWRPSDRSKLYIDFVSRTYQLQDGGERWLVIPEVHNFAPKGRVLSPQVGEMIHWTSVLASEGQGMGLILLLDSQRAQKVHNDVLAACETLIACRVIHNADRQAIKDWIDGNGDPKVGAAMLAELANMPRTDAYVWSPEIEFGPEKITWPLFKTYDSFKPQPANQKKLTGWADVDLEEVRAKLATVVAEAEANDPKMLRKRVADLEQQLRTGRGPSLEDLAAAEEKGFQRGVALGREAQCALLSTLQLKLESAVDSIIDAAKPDAGPLIQVVTRPSPSKLKPVTREALVSVAKATASNGHATDEPPSVRKILDVIHRSYPVSLSFDAAARRAGISSASSAYRKYRVLVHGSREIEQVDGKYRSLPEHAGNAPMTSESSLALWIQKLPPSYGKMLEAIHQHGPVDKERIADLAGVSSTSSGLGTGLRELQRLQLISNNDGCYDVEDDLR